MSLAMKHVIWKVVQRHRSNGASVQKGSTTSAENDQGTVACRLCGSLLSITFFAPSISADPAPSER